MWEFFGIWGLLFGYLIPLIIAIITKQTFDYYVLFLSILVFLFLIIFSWFIFIIKVSAIQDKEKTEKISIKEYDDLLIENFSSPETIDEKRSRLQLWFPFKTKKLEFLVKNNGPCSVLNARISMTDIKFISPKYNNLPDGIETKSFVWDDINTNNGTRNISPKGYGHLIIARYVSDDTLPYFNFFLFDGVSKVPRSIPGNYILTIRLDGQVQKKESIEDLLPIFFKLSFDFDNQGFQNINILKLPRK